MFSPEEIVDNPAGVETGESEADVEWKISEKAGNCLPQSSSNDLKILFAVGGFNIVSWMNGAYAIPHYHVPVDFFTSNPLALPHSMADADPEFVRRATEYRIAQARRRGVPEGLIQVGDLGDEPPLPSREEIMHCVQGTGDAVGGESGLRVTPDGNQSGRPD